MKDELEYFYYKYIGKNMDFLASMFAVFVTYITIAFISFHIISLVAPSKTMREYCERDPVNGFTTLYYWFEYPGRTTACWLWLRKDYIEPLENEVKLEDFLPPQNCEGGFTPIDK